MQGQSHWVLIVLWKYELINKIKFVSKKIVKKLKTVVNKQRSEYYLLKKTQPNGPINLESSLDMAI